jgi:WD40 repeat protein
MTASPLGRHAGRGLQVWDEESGELHRELEAFTLAPVWALATFPSADGRQVRLVAGAMRGELRVYDPEAGSVLHRLHGHTSHVADLACIATSSAAPHHPRLVSVSYDGTAKVWDGDTGERVAELQRPLGAAACVAVWKEHGGGHDRIATAAGRGIVQVYDGETFGLLHDLDCGSSGKQLLHFNSAEGTNLLLVMTSSLQGEVQLWDPEEGRLLWGGIICGFPCQHFHLFQSEGRHRLAISSYGEHHSRHPDDPDVTMRAFLDVWDLGEVPAGTDHLRPAHHLG